MQTNTATITKNKLPNFIIHEYRDEFSQHFYDINAQWIEDDFYLEEADIKVLKHPREKILNDGGIILFVEAEGLGIVGTCALKRTSQTGFELTKMGVLKTARGLKAGEFLLTTIIERAKSMGADPLYLLTNKKAEAAIHLYEKLGFKNDAEIMDKYGKSYERCNVAMRYCGW